MTNRREIAVESNHMQISLQSVAVCTSVEYAVCVASYVDRLGLNVQHYRLQSTNKKR